MADSVEKFTASEVQAKMGVINGHFGLIGGSLDNANYMVALGLSSPSEAMYGDGATKILATWDENSSSLQDFIKVFDDWSGMVVAIGNKYANLEEGTYKVRDADIKSISDVALKNRTTSLKTDGGTTGFAKAQEHYKSRKNIDEYGISTNVEYILENGKITKKETYDGFDGYYKELAYDPEQKKYVYKYYDKDGNSIEEKNFTAALANNNDEYAEKIASARIDEIYSLKTKIEEKRKHINGASDDQELQSMQERLKELEKGEDLPDSVKIKFDEKKSAYDTLNAAGEGTEAAENQGATDSSELPTKYGYYSLKYDDNNKLIEVYDEKGIKLNGDGVAAIANAAKVPLSSSVKVSNNKKETETSETTEQEKPETSKTNEDTSKTNEYTLKNGDNSITVDGKTYNIKTTNGEISSITNADGRRITSAAEIATIAGVTGNILYNGKVYKKTTEGYEVYGVKDGVAETRTFTDNGLTVKTVDKKGVETVTQYDTNGTRKYQQITDGDSITTNTYHGTHLYQQEEKELSDGNLIMTTTTTFNGDGKVYKEEIVTAGNNQTKEKTYKYNKDGDYSVSTTRDGIHTRTDYFDSQGNQTQYDSYFYSRDGELKSTTSVEYVGEGHRVVSYSKADGSYRHTIDINDDTSTVVEKYGTIKDSDGNEHGMGYKIENGKVVFEGNEKEDNHYFIKYGFVTDDGEANTELINSVLDSSKKDNSIHFTNPNPDVYDSSNNANKAISNMFSPEEGEPILENGDLVVVSPEDKLYYRFAAHGDVTQISTIDITGGDNIVTLKYHEATDDRPAYFEDMTMYEGEKEHRYYYADTIKSSNDHSDTITTNGEYSTLQETRKENGESILGSEYNGDETQPITGQDYLEILYNNHPTASASENKVGQARTEVNVGTLDISEYGDVGENTTFPSTITIENDKINDLKLTWDNSLRLYKGSCKYNDKEIEVVYDNETKKIYYYHD